MDAGLLEHIGGMLMPPAVDRNGEWIFMRNGRTGSTSILNGIMGRRTIMKQHGEQRWLRYLRSVIDRPFLFTFVRNPWDRLVSAFCFLQRTRALSWQYTFQEYLKAALDKCEIVLNEHFMPQHETYLFTTPAIVYVGRYENLQNDWNDMAAILHVPHKLPRMNATAHRQYRSYYDDQTRDIVGRYYATEIECLGYKF